MKKILCFLTAAMLLFSLTACGGSNPAASEPPVPETESPALSPEPSQAPAGASMGQALLADFTERVNANGDLHAEELAGALLQNPVIEFDGGAAPVEPGLLTGFGNREITGFEEGVMFAPMISTIPFVGYVFLLAEDADGDAFVQTLKDNADPRWNICTEADETVAEHVGNFVFFVMCPAEA